jgi:hypothetical protein
MWNANKTLGISKRWHLVTPPLTFVGNYNMGNIMEKGNWENIWLVPHVVGSWMSNMAMGKWKDKQIKSCITKTNCKHSKGGYGRLLMGDVFTCHGLL